ncbi:hypothetical protein DFH09DRAFT_1067085 [Mycena vulgaris]|nr:hypothetical protein DFH09DRAFT_1067085 [Mycena vulgaris]
MSDAELASLTVEPAPSSKPVDALQALLVSDIVNDGSYATVVEYLSITCVLADPGIQCRSEEIADQQGTILTLNMELVYALLVFHLGRNALDVPKIIKDVSKSHPPHYFQERRHYHALKAEGFCQQGPMHIAQTDGINLIQTVYLTCPFKATTVEYFRSIMMESLGFLEVQGPNTEEGVLSEGVLGGDNGTSGKHEWFQCVYTRLGAVWSTCRAVKRVKYLCFNVCGGWLAYGKSGWLLYCFALTQPRAPTTCCAVGAWIGAKEQPRFMSRPEMNRLSHELSNGMRNGCQIGANEPETPERIAQPEPVPNWDANCLRSISVGIASAVELQTMGRMSGEVEDGQSGCYPVWAVGAAQGHTQSVYRPHNGDEDAMLWEEIGPNKCGHMTQANYTQTYCVRIPLTGLAIKPRLVHYIHTCVCVAVKSFVTSGIVGEDMEELLTGAEEDEGDWTDEKDKEVPEVHVENTVNRDWGLSADHRMFLHNWDDNLVHFVVGQHNEVAPKDSKEGPSSTRHVPECSEDAADPIIATAIVSRKAKAAPAPKIYTSDYPSPDMHCLVTTGVQCWSCGCDASMADGRWVHQGRLVVPLCSTYHAVLPPCTICNKNIGFCSDAKGCREPRYTNLTWWLRQTRLRIEDCTTPDCGKPHYRNYAQCQKCQAEKLCLMPDCGKHHDRNGAQCTECKKICRQKAMSKTYSAAPSPVVDTMQTSTSHNPIPYYYYYNPPTSSPTPPAATPPVRSVKKVTNNRAPVRSGKTAANNRPQTVEELRTKFDQLLEDPRLAGLFSVTANFPSQTLATHPTTLHPRPPHLLSGHEAEPHKKQKLNTGKSRPVNKSPLVLDLDSDKSLHLLRGEEQARPKKKKVVFGTEQGLAYSISTCILLSSD